MILYNFRYLLIFLNHIKKILKHLDLGEVKRKPHPMANAPPIDVFPAYYEQPGPSTDDYTCLRRIRDLDYPAEAYFKNHTRAVRLPMPKIPYIYNILDKNRRLTTRIVSVI